MKKTVIICDDCGVDLRGGGATLALRLAGSKAVALRADLCDACAGKLPGVGLGRRTRRAAASA